MSGKDVQNQVKFTCNFLPEEDVKVIVLDKNIIIFKFGIWVQLKMFFETRPWCINDNLVVLHHYNPSIIYEELEWDFQEFWINLKYLMRAYESKQSEGNGRSYGRSDCN